MQSFHIAKEQWLSWKFLTMTSRFSIAKPALTAQRRYAVLWARNGIFHGLAALKVLRGERVLVPSYICTAAVEPILAYGAEVVFYRVDRDCRPDFEHIKSRITPSTRAIIAVHYFGFPQQIRKFQDFCRDHHLSLIEDCAHVLEGHSEGIALGSFGDVSVFSWRKFLPVYDGADLLLNRTSVEPHIAWQREHPLFTIKVAKNLIEDAIGPLSQPWLGYVTRSLHTIRSRAKRRLVWFSGTIPPHDVEVNTDSFDPRLVHWSMSRLSRWIKAHSNVPAIVSARRSNYRYLQERLSHIGGIVSLHPQLPDGVCPWVLPVVFEGICDAHKMLRDMGVPAVTWGGVRPSLLKCNEFPDAEFLYDNLVFLPIHQSLTGTDLDGIVSSVSAVLKKGL
jgi:dTDP-4-amino-4,6-dideoxygalactose transaminase